jgi:hypothetical protein
LWFSFRSIAHRLHSKSNRDVVGRSVQFKVLVLQGLYNVQRIGPIRIRRLKLLEIGALVRISVRRIRIAMASACPTAKVWGIAAIRLALAALARASPA